MQFGAGELAVSSRSPSAAASAEPTRGGKLALRHQAGADGGKNFLRYVAHVVPKPVPKPTHGAARAPCARCRSRSKTRASRKRSIATTTLDYVAPDAAARPTSAWNRANAAVCEPLCHRLDRRRIFCPSSSRQPKTWWLRHGVFVPTFPGYSAVIGLDRGCLPSYWLT